MSLQKGDLVDNKFTWVIQNFKQFTKIYSNEFVIGGCKWKLHVLPKRYLGCSSLYLTVAEYDSLPCEWRRRAKVSFTLVNQVSPYRSRERVLTQQWFDERTPSQGIYNILHARDSGFLVNGALKIIAEVNVLEVIGKLDVPEAAKVVTQPLKKIKLNYVGNVSGDMHKETSPVVNESVDVNGFLVIPSQVDLARRVFERHPEIALECRTKNQDLRTSYMNVLLNLVKMLFKSPLEISTDDLSDATSALGYTKSVGFKLDWLEKKLDKVKENKKKCDRVRELEQQLHDLKQKTEDLETQPNEEKKIFGSYSS